MAKRESMADRAVRRMENQRYQRQVTRQAQARAKAAEKDRGVWKKGK